MRSFLRQLRQGVYGLQFRTTILLTCVVLAATGLTGILYLRISARVTLAESKRHARNIAKTLAATARDAVEQRDRQALLRMTELLVPSGDLAYVFFTDMTGEFIAGSQRGAGNLTPFALEGARHFSVQPINQPRVTVQSDGDSLVDIVYPVTSRSRIADAGEGLTPTVGYVRLGTSLANTELALAEMVRVVSGLAVGITLLMVPLGYEVVRHLVKPINRLADTARALAGGDPAARAPVERRDEIGALAGAFNTMADDLTRSHGELVQLNADLEDRVIRRTVALEEANNRLREMAVRDSLTGLYNRRHFTELLERLFSEAKRYNTDITCMMLDLDNFKKVNDSLGHQVGDRLLQLTAQVITEAIRESDIAVRFGGDEFVVLLPRTSSVDARSSAERTLAHFRTTLMRELPEANITSLSIGLASREEDQPAEAIDLVNLADEALYLAKAGGKNRITVLRPAAA